VKQERFILILSGLDFLIGFLVGIMAITSDLLGGMDADQAAIRNGMEQGFTWFGATPNLTNDQQTGIRPIFEDRHNQIFGLRQRDTQNEAPYMEFYNQAQRGVSVCRCFLLAERN